MAKSKKNAFTSVDVLDARTINLRSSQVDFSHSLDLVDVDSRPKTISELVAEANRTGQMPYSTKRDAVPRFQNMDVSLPDGFDRLSEIQSADRFSRSFENELQKMPVENGDS